MRDIPLCRCAKAAALLIAACLSLTPCAFAAGTLSGKVAADVDGAPLAGAKVTVYRSNPAPGVTQTVTTGADGSFSVSGLAPGRYGICVKPASGAYIDPCGWADLLKTVQVSDGATAAAGSIRLRAATVLRVRVNDAAQALAKKAGDKAPPHVLVGVFDFRGMFHAAAEIRRDGAGVSFELPMPPDLPVTLRVYSGQVKLETEQHASVSAKGYSEVVIHSQKSPPTVHNFNAIGRI